jgi:hypothetical protein
MITDYVCYCKSLYARFTRSCRSCMVIVHAESLCGVQYQIPRCLIGNTDKPFRTGRVESAFTALYDLDSDLEISRPPTACPAPDDNAPRRADTCICTTPEQALDGLNSDIATWVCASAPYRLTRSGMGEAWRLKLRNPIMVGLSRTMVRILTFEVLRCEGRSKLR